MLTSIILTVTEQISKWVLLVLTALKFNGIDCCLIRINAGLSLRRRKASSTKNKSENSFSIREYCDVDGRTVTVLPLGASSLTDTLK